MTNWSKAIKRWTLKRVLGCGVRGGIVLICAALLTGVTYYGYQYVRSLNPRELGGHQNPVFACVLLADSNRVATMCSQHVRICNLRGGEPILLSGHSGEMKRMVATPDGAQLVTASKDGTIKVWETASGTELTAFKASKMGAVSGLAISNDGTVVATVSEHGLVSIWQTDPWKLTKSYDCRLVNVTCAALDGSGMRIAIASQDGSILIKAWKGDEPALSLDGSSSPVFALAFSPNGEMLATGGKNRRIVVWRIKEAQPEIELVGHWGKINALEFSPDGSKLVSAASDFTIGIWDTASGLLLQQHGRHPSQVMCMDCDFAKDVILTGGYGPSAKVWKGFLNK